MTVTDALANPARRGSVSSRLRAGRWSRLLAEFPDLRDMRVLDIGGTLQAWDRAPVRPRELVLFNLDEVAREDEGRDASVTVVAGDACDPPAWLLRERFDLVHSNSVIEHVGGHERRVRFADTVTSVGDRLWVQTPYRYFPIEQHAFFPGLQFMPPQLQAEALRHWPIGNSRRFMKGWPRPAVVADDDRRYAGQPLGRVPRYHAIRTALGTELLSVSMLSFYFPAARVIRERVAGLTKSIIAVG